MQKSRLGNAAAKILSKLHFGEKFLADGIPKLWQNIFHYFWQISGGNAVKRQAFVTDNATQYATAFVIKHFFPGL